MAQFGNLERWLFSREMAQFNNREGRHSLIIERDGTVWLQRGMAQCDCREAWHSLIVERDGSFIVTVVCHDVRWYVMVSVMTFLHREGGLSWQ